MDNIIHLYVNDLRDCPDGFTVASTFEEAIALMSHEGSLILFQETM